MLPGAYYLVEGPAVENAHYYDKNVPDKTGDASKMPGMLKQLIFGAKFDMSFFEVAAQLTMQNYGVYFGGQFEQGPVTAGLSFMGEMDNPTDQKLKGGASGVYNAGSFGVGLKAKLENWKDKTGSQNAWTLISVEPDFFINAIPSHLQFRLNTGFYFQTPTVNGTKQSMDTYWGVQPALYWNFLGTGATDDPTTGIIAKYKMFSGCTNALDLIFKWSI